MHLKAPEWDSQPDLVSVIGSATESRNDSQPGRAVCLAKPALRSAT